MEKIIRGVGRFIAIVFATVLLANTFSLAQDVGSGGIGGRPAFPREGNSRSESIFIHTIDAGQGVSDGIKVINNTEDTRTIQVYAADSVVSSGGAFACAQFVDEKIDVASWITLDKQEVTLESSGTEIVNFSIDVPQNTDVGEHDGCIVVQEKKPVTENEQGIGLSFRTAIRVAVLVPGEIVKDIEIVNFQQVINNEDVVLTPSIINKGNVSVDAEITTTINHFWGTQITEAGGRFPVLRGQTGEWNFKHDRPFWGGIYKAEVIASYDSSTDTFIGDDEGEQRQLTYNSIWFFVQPHPIAFAIELLLLVALIYGLWWLAKRKKAKRSIAKEWGTYTVKTGDNIKSIAKKHDLDWKRLAKANRLKAPYTLDAGTKIKVPRRNTKAKSKTNRIDVIK